VLCQGDYSDWGTARSVGGSNGSSEKRIPSSVTETLSLQNMQFTGQCVPSVNCPAHDVDNLQSCAKQIKDK
jgi:hypothetical protein